VTAVSGRPADGAVGAGGVGEGHERDADSGGQGRRRRRGVEGRIAAMSVTIYLKRSLIGEERYAGLRGM
jgi:hypothetical protein